MSDTVFLACSGDLFDYTSEISAPDNIAELLRDLSECEVTPVVRADADEAVFDIFLDDRSVGHNATRAYCLVYGLRMPQTVEDADDAYAISRTGDYDG